MKRFPASLLAVLLLFSCFSISAAASARASAKFDVTLAAGELKFVNSSLPMAKGEIVKINASYSPTSCDIDFGLVDKDGYFHHSSGENGSFNISIEITANGTYWFAIRNNSDETVSVVGFINY